jgi:hypothetical protein
MDKARKKAMASQYKQTPLSMGVYQIRCLAEPRCYIGTAKNLKGKMNGDVFKLSAGNHVNKELQRAWDLYGKDRFAVDILEELEYNSAEPEADYTEDLEILKSVWADKLAAENIALYH